MTCEDVFYCPSDADEKRSRYVYGDPEARNCDAGCDPTNTEVDGGNTCVCKDEHYGDCCTEGK